MTHLKKTLLACATLSAIAAPGLALAQSSVTLFGVLDLAYENVKTQAGRISGVSPSGNSASRIGFRGTEDLGSGLSAGFWLEGAINPASGIGSSGTTTNNQRSDIAAGGLTFNRRSTVSLTGAFGELRIGRDTTPSWQNYLNADPFAAAGVGTLILDYTGSAATNTFVRASNSLGYFLPANLGGIYGQAMVAFGNQPSNATLNSIDTSSNGRYAGARLGYRQGPLDVAAAYTRTTFAGLTQSLGNNGLAGPGTSGAAAPLAGDLADTSVYGAYDVGAAKVVGIVAQQKLSNVATTGNDLSTKGWSLGVNAPVGAFNVLASLGQVKLGSAKAQKIAIGGIYNLSKRTAAYATFARVSNSGGASIAANSYGSGALSPVTGASNVNGNSTGIDIGLRVSF